MELIVPHSVDNVVLSYWRKEGDFIQSQINDYFSPDCYRRTFDQKVSEKRGLIGDAEVAVHNAFLLIAAGFDDVGLEHADWAVRLAEAAIKFNDYGAEIGMTEVFGHSRSYQYLYYGKWLLSHPDSDSVAREWVERVRAVYLQSELAAGSKEERELYTWEFVIPFLVVGDASKAREVYREVFRGEDKPLNRIRSVPELLRVLFQILADHSASRESQINVANRFLYDISGWGHQNHTPRGRLWRSFVIEQHVAIASIIARNFNLIYDAKQVVKSIKSPCILIKQ